MYERGSGDESNASRWKNSDRPGIYLSAGCCCREKCAGYITQCLQTEQNRTELGTKKQTNTGHHISSI